MLTSRLKRLIIAAAYFIVGGIALPAMIGTGTAHASVLVDGVYSIEKTGVTLKPLLLRDATEWRSDDSRLTFDGSNVWFGSASNGQTITQNGTASLWWRNAGYDQDGDAVDLKLVLSNIQFKNRGNWPSNHILYDDYGANVIWANADGDWTETSGQGTSITFTMYVYKHGTSTIATGWFPMGFKDLDINRYWQVWCEQVQLNSGYGNVHLNSGHKLNVEYGTNTVTFKATVTDDETYQSGFSTTFSPNGSSFTWRGDSCGTAVLVSFGVNYITASKGQGGTITAEGTTPIGYNGVRKYVARPYDGWTNSNIVVDGSYNQGAVGSYTFDGVKENHTISASFTRLSGKLTLNKKSADTSLSVTNQYNLAGAEYTLYRESTCDNVMTDVNGNTVKLTTTSNGSSNTATLWYCNSVDGNNANRTPATYYLKETKASPGYYLDPTVYPVTINSNGTVTKVSSEPTQYGYIKVVKLSGNTSWTVGNDRYSLKDAEYTVYRDGTAVTTLKTGDDGTITSDKLPCGTYTVKETKASKGFLVDPTEFTVVVEEQSAMRTKTTFSPKTYTVTSTETPKSGFINVIKKSNVSWTNGNACYSVEGVKYDMTGPVAVANHSYTTDATGYAEYIEVPLGDYYMTEQLPAATGYYPDSTTYHVDIAEHGQYESVRPKCIPLVDTYPFSLAKYDADDWGNAKNGKPQAGATLEDAYYSVTYYDGYYSTVNDAKNGNAQWTKFFFTKNNVDGIASIVPASSDLYDDSTTKKGWGLGTYVVEEVIAPDGYYLDENSPYVFQITENIDGDDYTANNAIVVGATQNAAASKMTDSNAMVSTEYLARADIKVIKTGADYTLSDSVPARTYKQEGVKFQIINDNDYDVYSMESNTWVSRGNVICTIVTNAQGEATTNSIATANGFANMLPLGTYIIHESENPNVGYKMSEDTTVTLGMSNFEYSFDIENKQGTALRITKKAEDTGFVIKAATSFSILDSDKNVMTLAGRTVFTTDSSGIITIPEKLMAGTYYVKEVKAPKGYQLSTELVEFGITSDDVDTFANPVSVDFFNVAAKSNAIIHNVDASSGDKIENTSCMMEVRAAENIKTADGQQRHSAGELIGTYNTVAGDIILSDLFPGAYTVKEITTPEGYNENSSVYSLVVGEQVNGYGGSVTVPNAHQTGGIQLYLKDSETKNVIREPGSYKIVNANPVMNSDGTIKYEAGTFVQYITTNENGWASTTSTIPAGAYLFYEVSAPDGYIASTEPVLALLVYDPESTEASVTIEDLNDPQKGTIKISKLDAESETIIVNNHAKFAIYAAENITTGDGTRRHSAGDEVAVVETNADGYAMAEGLYIGNYFVREVQAPDGYMLDSENRIHVAVTYNGGESSSAIGGISEVDFYDEPVMGMISVKKVDSDENQVVTGKTMECEIRAAENILASDGSVLYSAGAVVDTVNTGADGTGTSDKLPLGKYNIVEIKAPAGYVVNSDPYEVELASDGTSNNIVLGTVIVKDIQQKGAIEITKKNSETDAAIKESGTEFAIVAAEDITNALGVKVHSKGDTVKIVSTNSEGKAIASNLVLGKYNVIETKAPSGYEINNAPVFVVLTNEDQSVDITTEQVVVYDGAERCKVKVIAKDNESKKTILSGGIKYDVVADDDVYTLDGQKIHSAGDTIATIVTGDDGTFVVDGLLPGDYKLVQTKAPSGYILNSEPVKFSVVVNDDGHLSADDVLHYSDKQRGDIVINKIDADSGEAIANNQAVFEIRALNDVVTADGVTHYTKNQLIDTVATNNDGTAIVSDLLIGGYKITEKIAPEGYYLADKPVECYILYAGQDEQRAKTVMINFRDTKKPEPVIPTPKPTPTPTPTPTPKPVPPVEDEKPIVAEPVEWVQQPDNTYVPVQVADTASEVIETPKAIVSNTGDILPIALIAGGIVIVAGAIMFATRRKK